MISVEENKELELKEVSLDEDIDEEFYDDERQRKPQGKKLRKFRVDMPN